MKIEGAKLICGNKLGIEERCEAKLSKGATKRVVILLIRKGCVGAQTAFAVRLVPYLI